MKIAGPGATDAVKTVLDATRTGASLNDIKKLFTRPSLPHVEKLVHELIERRLLIPSDDSDTRVHEKDNHTDIFYWHFRETTEGVSARLNKIRFVIIGINYISRQLAIALTACGHRNFEVVDHPRQRNINLFDENGHLNNDEWPPRLARPSERKDDQAAELGDCAIVTSDFGGQEAVRHWNKVCLERGKPFMPVILKNMVGYVGPLVIPGETPCYECLYYRQRSHTMDESESLADRMAFEAQQVAGFHPVMAAMLGDIAAFELTRFYGGGMPARRIGGLIEVNLLAARMTERHVLKVPRCIACSPLHRHSCTNLSKETFS